MANEISLNTRLSVDKNGATINMDNGVVGTLSGTKMIENIQIITTGGASVFLGDVSTAELVVLRNLDSTNFVTCILDGSGTAIKLKPLGYPLVLPASLFNPANIELAADTASCRVQVIAFEA